MVNPAIYAKVKYLIQCSVLQWECVAELPAEVKFGQINVLCEGYDYPDDPYILRGSCGVSDSQPARVISLYIGL